MKLTVVKFAGRLRVKDQRGIFQQAVYEDAVRVFHVPTENLNETIVEHAAPPRSVVLRCTDTLTVSQYKGKDGTEGTRQMKAVGGARVQDDAYVGDGHSKSRVGPLLTADPHVVRWELTGGDLGTAQLDITAQPQGGGARIRIPITTNSAIESAARSQPARTTIHFGP